MKMKFNIIIIVTILCLFKTSLCFLKHSSPDTNLMRKNEIRFIEKELLGKNTNTEVEKKMKIKIKENLKTKEKEVDENQHKYNVEINIVKETDSDYAEPIVLKNPLVFGKKTLDLLDEITGNIQKSISYLR